MKLRMVVIGILFLTSCGSGKPFEKRISQVFGNEVFRGHHLGDSYTTVMKSENSKYLLFPDSNVLKYRYQVTDSEEYHWAYVFSEDKLKQIQFDAYLGDTGDGTIYCENIKRRYKKNWGEPSQKNGIFSWNKEGICIDLMNESPLVSMGKVKMLFYYKGDTTVLQYVPGLE